MTKPFGRSCGKFTFWFSCLVLLPQTLREKCPGVSLKTTQESLKMPPFSSGNWADFFLFYFLTVSTMSFCWLYEVLMWTLSPDHLSF